MIRNIYWDSLKFILIFFVVLGHVIGLYRMDNTINMTIVHEIYLFHMPLFVFISGHFSLIRDKKNYIWKIFRLIETYVLFQLIWLVINYILGEKISIRDLITPIFALWYLLSLVIWRLVVYFCPPPPSGVGKKKIVIICSFIIGIIGGFIPIGMEFGIQKTLAFFPFFMLGYYFKEEDIKRIIMINKHFAIAVLLIVFVLLYFFVRNPEFQYILTLRCSYYFFGNDKVLTLFLSRIVYYIVALIMGVLVMCLVPNNESFSKWGQDTMIIYIYHCFFLIFIKFGVSHCFLSSNLLFLIVYSIVTTVVLLLFARIEISKLLLNPISNSWEWIKKCLPNGSK